MTKLHGRKIRHAAAHHRVPLRHKAELLQQRPGGFAFGQGGSKQRFALDVIPTVLLQNFFDKVAAIPAPPPARGDLHPKPPRLQRGRADGGFFFI